MDIALYATAFLLLFLILPSFVITLLLFKRKTVSDFDERGENGMRSYSAYSDEILGDMAFMRSLKPTELSIKSRDGLDLKADWYDNGGKRTVIFAHGFCSTPLNNFSTLGREFYARGYDLMMISQRAHGKSGGAFTTLGLKECGDLMEWIALAEKLVPNGEIVLYGMSMGGAAVAFASDRIVSPSVRTLVIDCCYCSPYEQMCKGKGMISILWLPIVPFVMLFSTLILGSGIRNRTTDSLAAARIPAAFVIGLCDKKVPPRFFRKNHAACASKKTLIEVADAPHALAFVAADAKTREKLFEFIDSCSADGAAS